MKRKLWVCRSQVTQSEIYQFQFGQKIMLYVWWNYVGVLYFELAPKSANSDTELRTARSSTAPKRTEFEQRSTSIYSVEIKGYFSRKMKDLCQELKGFFFKSHIVLKDGNYEAVRSGCEKLNIRFKINGVVLGLNWKSTWLKDE